MQCRSVYGNVNFTPRDFPYFNEQTNIFGQLANRQRQQRHAMFLKFNFLWNAGSAAAHRDDFHDLEGEDDFGGTPKSTGGTPVPPQKDLLKYSLHIPRP
jgi:hypothetical protein